MQTRPAPPSRKTSFRFQGVTPLFLIFTPICIAHAAIDPGPLEQTVINTYRLGNYLDPCETSPSQKAIRLNLARALDDRELEMNDFLRAGDRIRRLDSSALNGLQIGPLALTPRLEPEKKQEGADPKNPIQAWTAKISGWEDFNQEYQSLRGTRVSAAWIRLRELVRSTVNDDYRRGVNGVWFRISHEGIEEAPEFTKKLKTCLEEKKCEDLGKIDSIKNALNLTPSTASDFSNFKKATTDTARERFLKKLIESLKPFLTYFDPVKQRGVRLSDPHTLTLSLDSGDFRGYETDLALIVDRFWKVGNDTLQIEWMTSTREEPLFRFVFLPLPRSGSQIDYLRRTITLGQGASESIPAHEIGRALGFRARYFPVWHPETCKYEDQSKPTDLLSDGRKGVVSTEHWDSLRKIYTEKP